MRITALAFASFLLASFLSPLVSSHEPKEYTILLTKEGTTPPTIPDDVLVQTDFLFFMNVDDRGELVIESSSMLMVTVYSMVQMTSPLTGSAALVIWMKMAARWTIHVW